MFRALQFLIPAVSLAWLTQLFVGCGNAGAHALSLPAPEASEDPEVVVSGEEILGTGSFASTAQSFLFPDETDPIVKRGLLSAEHPYLLVESKDLIAEALDPTTERSRIYAAIKQEVDAAGANCPFGGLAGFGFCYWVTGNTAYAKAVHSQLRALANRAEWNGGERSRISTVRLIQYALGFDFCHDYLKKQPDFQRLRDKLAHETFKSYEALTGDYNSTWKNWWRHSYTQNHFHRNAAGIVYGSLALKFEGNELSHYSQRDVNKWIEAVKDAWVKNHAATKDISDGSWYEGNGYEETTLGADVPDPLHLLKRIEGLDLITTSPWLFMAPVFWIYNSNPENARYRLTQCGDLGAAWMRKNGFLSTLRLCAREFRDPYAQWAADQLVRDAKRDARFSVSPLYSQAIVHEFFYYDETVPSRSPEGRWPESWHARDLEMTFMRTGWQKGQLHAALKCGAYGGHNLFELSRANYELRKGKWVNRGYPVGGNAGRYPQDIHFAPGHAHADNNGFYIVGGGVYLAPERPGKLVTTTVGEIRMSLAHNTITIDGRGQIGDGMVHPSLGQDRPEFFKSDGSIPIFAPTANFDLSVGDATRCYPRALGVREFRRHFFFLKSDYFVVFDSLAADAPKEYTWNCHFTDKVSFDGRWVKGLAEKGNVLGVNVVSPSSYSRETGSLSSEHFRYIASDSEINYLRLTAKGEAKRRFITVLYPTTTESWTRRPTVEKISENNTAAGVRVTHKSGAKDVILSGYNASGLTTIGSYRLDGVGAAVRRDPNGGLLSVYLAKGQRVDEGNQLLVRLATTGGSFEASFNGEHVEVTGVNVPSFELHAPGAKVVTVNGVAADFTRDGAQITVEP